MPRLGWRNAPWCQVAMAIIGRALVRPGRKRNHRAIGNESTLLEELVHYATAGISATAKARRPNSKTHEFIIDRAQFRSNHGIRMIVQKCHSSRWDCIDCNGWRVPGMDVHPDFHTASLPQLQQNLPRFSVFQNRQVCEIRGSDAVLRA